MALVLGALVTFQSHADKSDDYKKRADRGDAQAQYELGLLYQGAGRGVRMDRKEAVKWFLKAAEQRHAKAQYELGVMYHNGHGVPQDYQEAIAWYRKAAEQGIIDAVKRLSMMYREGRIASQDYKEAVSRGLGVAAEKGSHLAQYHLGNMYRETQDYEEAVKWYHRAVEQRNGWALYDLGVMYHHGEGVSQDYVQAYVFYHFAYFTHTKQEKAKQNRDIVAKAMTPEQIAEAKAMIKDWAERAWRSGKPWISVGP